MALGLPVVAHNAAFERAIWNIKLRRLEGYPWPELTIAQQHCTMARAAAVDLPQSLDQLNEVLNLPSKKDKAGYSLMLKMAKPRKINADGSVVWWDDPDNIARLGDYCDDDVRAETDADATVPVLSASERWLWEQDQTINERGFALDMRSVERALAIVEIAKRDADREMNRLTEGAVKKCSQTAKIVEWLTGRGFEVTSIAKNEYEELVAISEFYGDEIAEKVLTLRRNSMKASTAKLRAMQNCVCDDGRARGLFRYHSAGTGRWTAAIVQPHNFPRVDEEKELPGVLEAFETINEVDDPQEAHDRLAVSQGDVIPLISRCLRGMIVAPEDKKLVGADFSNIEGRVNAWISGEDWKLQAFRDFDNRVGHDLYKLAYAKSFNVDIETISKPQRQIGKVEELALGYQGSVGAFISMGINYGLKPDDIRVAITSQFYGTPEWIKAAEQYERATNRYRLSADQWISLKFVVNGFRTANAKIAQSWWDLQDAAIEATATPGIIVPCCNDKVKYLVAENVLWCQLPSGRVLAYNRPRIVEQVEMIELLDDDGNPTGDFVEGNRVKHVVKFEGVHPKTKKWSVLSLYGGLQSNNVVQGTARDLLVKGLANVERAGYPVVLHVHDELVAEIEKEFGSPQHFASLMSTLPPWAQGLPVTAGAWEHQRYVK